MSDREKHPDTHAGRYEPEFEIGDSGLSDDELSKLRALFSPSPDDDTDDPEETAVADTASTTSAPPAQEQETADQRVERIVAERVAAAQAKAAEEARIEALVAEKLAAAQAPTETEEQRVERLVAERLAAAQTATAPPASAPAQETEEQRIARMVTAALQTDAERNGVSRKGYVAPPSGAPATTESGSGLPADWPDKPLHEYTREEWAAHVAPATERAIMGGRSVFRALPA